MARLSLSCTCGWKFFIPESTQGHEVTCSSCGRPVSIPGRRPGEEVLSPGMLAAQKIRKQAQVKLLIGLGVGVVVLGVVLAVVVGGGGSRPDSADGDHPGRERPPRSGPGETGRSNGPNPPSEPVKNPEPPPRPPAEPDKVPALRRSVSETQWQINIAGVVLEALRLRGCASEAARLASRMEKLSAELLRGVGELAAQGDKQSVDTHLEPGDRIVVFAQQNLTALRPAEAAAFLEGWLLKLKTGNLEQVQILRGKERVGVYLFFPEQTPEMSQLIKLLATAAADGPISSPPVFSDPGAPGAPPAPLVDVPPALVKEIRSRMLALPPIYVSQFPPEEIRRMESLFKDMKGSGDDLLFLNSRVMGELIAKSEGDLITIKTKIAELEPKAKESTAQDTVFFKDGRKVEGKVEEETDDFLKIRSRFGSVKVLRGDISRIERGKGAGVQFPDKLKAAQGKAPDLVALMVWCKENNLKVEKEYVAYLALALDPLNEKARAEVGLAKPLSGGRSGLPETASPPKADTAAAIELLAIEVSRRFAALGDVVNAMRSGTESYRYPYPVIPPEKSAAGVRYMGNPLTFSPSGLPAQAAVEVGTWWGSLLVEDRKEFAKFFGLWCAYQRQMSLPRR